MSMGTLGTTTQSPKNEHGDTLHCQKAPHTWTWGNFTLPKSHLYTGMGALCTAEKQPIYGHGDTLHCRKAPYIWGSLSLPKSRLYMGYWNTLQCQKVPNMWPWGHIALPYMGMGTLFMSSTPRQPQITFHSKTLGTRKPQGTCGVGLSMAGGGVRHKLRPWRPMNMCVLLFVVIWKSWTLCQRRCSWLLLPIYSQQTCSAGTGTSVRMSNLWCKMNATSSTPRGSN